LTNLPIVVFDNYHTTIGRVGDVSKTPEDVFKTATTPILCQALETLAAKKTLTRHESQATTWLIQEIERRVPSTDQAVADLFDQNEKATRADYIRVLLAAAREDSTSAGGAR
jgi:hypothetical protein